MSYLSRGGKRYALRLRHFTIRQGVAGGYRRLASRFAAGGSNSETEPEFALADVDGGLSANCREFRLRPRPAALQSGRLVRSFAIDHPRNTKPIDEHPETSSPEGLLERHHDRAVLR